VRSPLRLTLPAAFAVATLAWALASAAETPDSRFGIVPVVGGGFAGLTAPQPLPGVIVYTTLGAEVFGQLRRWGLFLRFDFLSTGNDDGNATSQSGWSAYSADLGASYRLFGDSDSISLFARGAFTYEHWIAQVDTVCQLLPFVPSSCNTLGHLAEGFEGDAIGVTVGARLELPLRRFYVAFGANFVPLVTVATSQDNPTLNTALQPGDTFQFRLDIAVGLRDTREEHRAHHDYNEHKNSF
jgi:hypothetical protein